MASQSRGLKRTGGDIHRFPSVVGASEVKSISLSSVSDSTTRATVATPTSGKKIRVIKISAWSVSTTAHRTEFYFDTGANGQSDRSKIIFSAVLDADGESGPNMQMVWPDGAGPVGAADDVLSVRTTGNISTSNEFEAMYREE